MLPTLYASNSRPIDGCVWGFAPSTDSDCGSEFASAAKTAIRCSRSESERISSVLHTYSSFAGSYTASREDVTARSTQSCPSEKYCSTETCIPAEAASAARVFTGTTEGNCTFRRSTTGTFRSLRSIDESSSV